MKHLILVGACYLDTILTVPHFPEEDSKLRATAIQVRRGGNCPNTLEVLQQLLLKDLNSDVKVRPHLVSCLPDIGSAATQRILSSFGTDDEESIVDFSHCLYRQGHNEAASSYIIRSRETGSRTIVNYNGLPEMTVNEFASIVETLVTPQQQGEEYWWHFEGRIPETALQCIHHLRRTLPESKISVEVEKPNRDGLVELAAEADVVFYSRSWAESRGYAGPDACLKGEAALKASLVLCTWGEQGACARWLSSGDEECIHCPANPSGREITVVDTIGAGDTFIAGMLYGLICHIEDWTREAKLSFAVGLATRKVQRDGFAGLAQPDGVPTA
ncbi:Ketohexokinase [Diplogelasinospora grovesii]|uniref:Ketohexokinase n=1 Tax=Diplogelasinospora grovesii TaxID=303347 RepID=A0AAN6N1W2_9PEZI|nr:Ketohexokinase [Diplogelasinospora grovesii]